MHIHIHIHIHKHIHYNTLYIHIHKHIHIHIHVCRTRISYEWEIHIHVCRTTISYEWGKKPFLWWCFWCYKCPSFFYNSFSSTSVNVYVRIPCERSIRGTWVSSYKWPSPIPVPYKCFSPNVYLSSTYVTLEHSCSFINPSGLYMYVRRVCSYIWHSWFIYMGMINHHLFQFVINMPRDWSLVGSSAFMMVSRMQSIQLSLHKPSQNKRQK